MSIFFLIPRKERERATFLWLSRLTEFIPALWGKKKFGFCSYKCNKQQTNTRTLHLIFSLVCYYNYNCCCCCCDSQATSCCSKLLLLNWRFPGFPKRYIFLHYTDIANLFIYFSTSGYLLSKTNGVFPFLRNSNDSKNMNVQSQKKPGRERGKRSGKKA